MLLIGTGLNDTAVSWLLSFNIKRGGFPQKVCLLHLASLLCLDVILSHFWFVLPPELQIFGFHYSVSSFPSAVCSQSTILHYAL